MATFTDSDKVHLIVRHAGIAAQHVTPLGQGATSAAWQVTSGPEAFILRFMPVGTNRPVTYQSEFTILRMLRKQGCPVPEPILSSVEMHAPLAGVPEPWAITRTVPGEAIRKNPLPSGVAQGLGRFLATVHDLPVTGFGRLVERADSLVGQQQEQRAGICARWCWADLWPFDGSDLRQHPFAQVKPEIQSSLDALEQAIIASLADEPTVLLHSDLHGEHLFALDGALTGVIDFGAAFIGVPAWEFAVIAFYHGWPTVQATLSAYGNCFEQRKFWQRIQLLAVVVGLYKLSRAVRAQAAGDKVARIVEFLSETVERLS
jgi:aminoglycoside phosphotransferase (APT) family kinase protein